MANSPQAKKRAKQNEKKRQINSSHRSRMRTFIKKVLYALEAKDKTEAEVAYKAAIPVIDSMVPKGIIHKNKAARFKSRLAKRIASLAA